MKFKDRLRELRKQNNLSQSNIVKLLGCSHNKYASWEQGRTEPNIDSIKALCKIFDTTSDFLLGFEDEYGKTINNERNILNFHKKFKDRLRELRKENRLNQTQLAERIGVDKSAISFWENGVNEPKANYITKLALLFNVSTDYLLGLEDEFGNKIDNNGDMYVKVVTHSKSNTVKPHYEKLTPEDIKLFEEIIAKLKKD